MGKKKRELSPAAKAAEAYIWRFRNKVFLASDPSSDEERAAKHSEARETMRTEAPWYTGAYGG